MNHFPRALNLFASKTAGKPTETQPQTPRVGVMGRAIGGPERLLTLGAFFPNVEFEALDPMTPLTAEQGFDVVIIGASARSHGELEAAVHRLRTAPAGAKVVVTLADADVTTTRALMREGAADVLPGPVGEAALALCLERLLNDDGLRPAPGPRTGEVVAFLKAGGGVGATALITQLAVMLAGRDRSICVADLDLQFGAVGLYLDTPDAMTITDCLRAPQGFEETPYAKALATHASGVRLLAVPRDLTPLEALSPAHIDALITGLRRDFSLTLLDLPSVWTAWTNQALHLADRIVLVTQLSVPHIDLVRRQLRALSMQGLDDRPLTLVCNGLTNDQQSSLTLKAAERAIGRPFDVILPEDRRTMTAAINQGVPLSTIRRGAKLEKAISELGERVAAMAAVATGATAKR